MLQPAGSLFAADATNLSTKRPKPVHLGYGQSSLHMENSARNAGQLKAMSSVTREMRGKIRLKAKSCISAFTPVVAWRAITTP